MVCEKDKGGSTVAKKVPALCIISLIILVLATQWKVNVSEASSDTVRIPDEAIRLRILADSNQAVDQKVKRAVRDAVVAEINHWVQELTSIEKARKVIRAHLDDIRVIVHRVLKQEDAEQSFHVKFGKAHFPTKMYGQYVYPAGVYEALVITLGAGEGANWWCVLFPPLCFLDFEHGDAVRTKNGDEPSISGKEQQIEVKFFVVEWFSALFKTVKKFFSLPF